MMRHLGLFLVIWLSAIPRLLAQEADFKKLASARVLEPGRVVADVQRYVEPRLPALPLALTAAAWEKDARRLRQNVLDKVVYRGEATAWRDARTQVDLQETVTGGPGYRLRKLRYEALPGLWIPALLYEPLALKGRVPAALCVMGHDRGGKEAEYQQIRCINLVKRGMVVLNLEWLNFGQLAGANYAHARMNQLDLCGTSGLAVFYLSLKRGLDVLASHENVDGQRISVSGLSGGGWQTIFLSALDERVALANPVAGYSSFRTRIREFMDLGDSEQTPCDLATVADYDHLTALMAPRPLLLTYNAKDNCCFQSGHALPPLLEGTGPFYRLFGKKDVFRAHVNHGPGTHNYEKENREAFYRMVEDVFFPGDRSYSAEEMPCEAEIKPRPEVAVKMPERNQDFNSLALALARRLPLTPTLPHDAQDRWQTERRQMLRELVKARAYEAVATEIATTKSDKSRVTSWRLDLGKDWSLPATVWEQGPVRGTVVLLHDEGRAAAGADVKELLAQGKRVVTVDPFYLGESRPESRDYLFALMLGTVGERPLGIQASQLAATARWARSLGATSTTSVRARGPRSSLIALVATALEPGSIDEAELAGSFGSLKEVLEQNRAFADMPEVFCFGLLRDFDIKQLTALAAPRPVRFLDPSERVRKELGDLRSWYRERGREFDPLASSAKGKLP